MGKGSIKSLFNDELTFQGFISRKKRIGIYMKIGPISIGKDHPPFIIAEMSGNHNQSLEKALEIVDQAATAGAHAIKLQTYRADTITMDIDSPDFCIDDPTSLWHKRKLYELYDEAHTPWEWHKPIMQRAEEKGLLCFSSPFDFEAVDFLESLNVPAYKIASFEITHLPLIKKCAQTGKPLIISTGNASIDDIQNAIQTAKAHGAKDIIILKCTSQYPADASNANLYTIPDMAQKFDVNIGLSDHTLGIGVAVASVALGAVIIEKHFTISRDEGGVDASFSLEPQELKSLVEETNRAWHALGEIYYSGTNAEQANKMFRQSIWFQRDVVAGEMITEDMIKICRPSTGGLPPKEYENILGKKLTKPVKRGIPVTKEYIDIK